MREESRVTDKDKDKRDKKDIKEEKEKKKESFKYIFLLVSTE